MWPFTKKVKTLDIYIEIFNNCDFNYAKIQLIETFSGGVYPKELIALLDKYVKNPCVETAIGLIKYDSSLLLVFKDNKNSLKFKASNGIDPYKVNKSVKSLMLEDRFEELCSSLTEDKIEHRKQRSNFMQKGYTDDVITKAIGEHYKELYDF